MIDLVFTLFVRDASESFPMGLVAVYKSMCRYTASTLCLHIITDATLTAEIKNKIIHSLRIDDRICFYDARSLASIYQLSLGLDGHFSPAIIWRLWVDSYLADLSRCVMLDCDLLFTFDVQLLWDLNLNGATLSAPMRGIPHPQKLHEWLGVSPERYFRTCCSVLDLERMRQARDFQNNRQLFLQEACDLAREGLVQAGFLDQSVFNRFFADSCLPLPVPVIPVERLPRHPRKEEWLKVLESNFPAVLDFKGWLNLTEYSREFWTMLKDSSWHEDATVQLKSFD